MNTPPIITVCLGEPPALAVGQTVIKFGTPLRTVVEVLDAYFGKHTIRVLADEKNDHKSVVLYLRKPKVKFVFHPRWHRLIWLTLKITDQTEVRHNQNILLSKRHNVRNNPSDIADKLCETLLWDVPSEVYFIKHGTSRLVIGPDYQGTDPAVVQARMEEVAIEFEEDPGPAGSPFSHPYPASSIEVPDMSPCSTETESYKTASEGDRDPSSTDSEECTDVVLEHGFLEVWSPRQRTPDGELEELFSLDMSSFSLPKLDPSLVLRTVTLYATDVSPWGKVMRIEHRSRRTVFITMNPSRQNNSTDRGVLGIAFGSHYEGVRKTLGDADDDKQGQNPFNEGEKISIYEYHNLGVDFGYNAVDGKLETVILHTCYPGHVDFDTYNRCIFSIQVPKETATMTGVCNIDTFSRAFTIRRLPADRSNTNEDPKNLRRLGCIFELLDNNRIAKVLVGA